MNTPVDQEETYVGKHNSPEHGTTNKPKLTRYEKFENLVLNRQTFKDDDLSEIIFINCKLRNCIFSNIIFKAASFYQCDLENSLFTKCDLRAAIIKRSRLVKSIFNECYMDYLELHDVQLYLETENVPVV